MKEIRLVNGKIALVDDEDFAWARQFRWYTDKRDGYAFRLENGHAFRMHREVMNAPTGMHVDHINHNRLDNRRDNLRLCTCAQNQWNSRPRKDGVSQWKGVVRVSRPGTKPWRAAIRVHGKKLYLGTFANQIDAAQAYDRAARQYFGEFAYTNFSNS
jgi:hypothetical protein